LVKTRLRQAFVGTSAVKFAERRGYSHYLTLVPKPKVLLRFDRAKTEPPVTWMRNQSGYVGTVKRNDQSDLTQGDRRYNSVQSNEEKMEF